MNHCSDLLVRQALDFTQDDHFAEVGRKLFERSLDPGDDVLLQQPFLWIERLIGHLIVRTVGHRRFLVAGAARSPAVPRIPDDREQPGTRIVVPKRREEPQSPHERVLDDVLGVRIVSREPARVVERGIEMRQDGFVEESRSHQRVLRPAGLRFYSRGITVALLLSLQEMALLTLIGRFHPLLIHFPIALAIAAAAAEAAATVTKSARWRTVAVGNVRAAAVFAVAAAIAGWRLSLSPIVEPSSILEWHRWLGTMAAAAIVVAACATPVIARGTRATWVYRAALFGAGALVAVAGHLGAALVWGADFLRP